MIKFKPLFALGLLLWIFASCVSEDEVKKLNKLPYYNLIGFLDLEVEKLEGVQVIKTSRINGEEKTVEKTYSLAEWKEEFEAFYQADINSPSLAQSYSTDIKNEYLIHKLLPEASGKIKEIKIKYFRDYPVSFTFQMADENLFFSSTTHGEFYMNLATNRLDHYSIETTQKVWFLKPTNIKVSGIVK